MEEMEEYEAAMAMAMTMVEERRRGCVRSTS